ncbi:MAG: hypothetical protein V1814_01885 [Candidatus Moraniibacteriota bacterium]
MVNTMEKGEKASEVADLQKRRAEKEMFKRIQKSLSKEKEPDVEEILQAIEKDDPSYLKLVK